MTTIPPLDVNAHTEIDIEDSCNCCWGRKVRKPPLNRRDGSSNLFSDVVVPVKDVNDVYNLNVNVHIDSPKPRRLSHGHRHSNDSPKQSKTTESLRSTDTDSTAKS